ncbi:hypothetical protein [Actinomadura sp. 9N407]|uniref:hypothetical protein n=1 Tax=Actinomadura sp. 9N407 TaxID=3375154 RepID=UPI003790F5F3
MRKSPDAIAREQLNAAYRRLDYSDTPTLDVRMDVGELAAQIALVDVLRRIADDLGAIRSALSDAPPQT